MTMTKTKMNKALVVGINTYPAPATPLKAAVREAGLWADLLRRDYGFDVSKPLETSLDRATVLGELRNLLSGVQSGEHRCLVWCGHGTRSLGWSSDTKHNTKTESALIVYTRSGSNGFEDYTITPSDITRILMDTKPPADSRFTLILDACFGAGFGDEKRLVSDGAMDPVVLFVPSGDEKRFDVRKISTVTFLKLADLIQEEAHGPMVTPLVLSASASGEAAYEIGETNDRELVFSAAAFKSLEVARRNGPELSSKALIEDIDTRTRLQEAQYYPKTTLAEELFLRGALPAPPLSVARLRQDTGESFVVQASKASLAASESLRANQTTTWGVAAGSLRIRVYGLATLIEGSDNSAFPNRIVFPYDDLATPTTRHLGFIEVAEVDMKCPPSVPPSRRYTRAGTIYLRWPLTEHRVRFANVAGGPGLVTRSVDYAVHVPGLTTVTPTLQPYPRTECHQPYPRPELFSAFIDLQNGQVDIGDLEDQNTYFLTEHTAVQTWGPEKTPLSVVYTIDLTGDVGPVLVTDINSEKPTVIFMKSGSTITIGNAREEDITGTGSGETPREHFKLYYNLAPTQPDDAGLPVVSSIPINACTVTNYP
jgi:hypothetical protein